MGTITRGSGSRVGLVLMDERGNFLLKKLAWMTSQVGWLERYKTNVELTVSTHVRIGKILVLYLNLFHNQNGV